MLLAEKLRLYAHNRFTFVYLCVCRCFINKRVLRSMETVTIGQQLLAAQNPLKEPSPAVAEPDFGSFSAQLYKHFVSESQLYYIVVMPTIP